MTTLTLAQTRLLGALIEKHYTTPLNYPMTPNAVRVACNQKSNRDPVVEYDDDLVFDTLRSLDKLGFVESGLLDGTQTVKYRHRVGPALGVEKGEVVVLCELFNRGPQTLAELRARCERMHRFADTAAVEASLERLRALGAVTLLERQPGAREARWAHLFCGVPVVAAKAEAPRASDLEERVRALEERVRILEEGQRPPGRG